MALAANSCFYQPFPTSDKSYIVFEIGRFIRKVMNYPKITGQGTYSYMSCSKTEYY